MPYCNLPFQVGSFHNPNSISAQPQTPQQQAQLGVPQRSVDGRFTSPASVPQRSPFPPHQQQSQQQSQPPQPQSHQPPSVPVQQPQVQQGHPIGRIQVQHVQPTQPALSANPLVANKYLILKELRKSLSEVSSRAEVLLNAKFCSDSQNSASNQSLSADTPKSMNPGSVGQSPEKTKQISTEEEFKQAKERFVYAVTVFLNVADEVDRNFVSSYFLLLVL